MPDQTGRTVIVTGANTGLGKEPAIAHGQGIDASPSPAPGERFTPDAPGDPDSR